MVRGTRAKKCLWDRGKQTGAVAAGPVGIDATAVRQAFERVERVLIVEGVRSLRGRVELELPPYVTLVNDPTPEVNGTTYVSVSQK